MCILSENDLNVNDILKTDLMPMYFMIDNEVNQNKAPINETQKITKPTNGSFDAAFSTMTFHR